MRGIRKTAVGVLAVVAIVMGGVACGAQSPSGGSSSDREKADDTIDVAGIEAEIQVMKACSVADFGPVMKKMQAKERHPRLEQKFGYGGNADGVACTALLESPEIHRRRPSGEKGEARKLDVEITVAIVPLESVENAKKHFASRLDFSLRQWDREKTEHGEVGTVSGPWDESAALDLTHTYNWSTYAQVRKGSYLVVAKIASGRDDLKSSHPKGGPQFYDKLPYDAKGLQALTVEQLKNTLAATEKELKRLGVK